MQYMVTWIPSIYPLYVSIYTSTIWIRHGIVINSIYWCLSAARFFHTVKTSAMKKPLGGSPTDDDDGGPAAWEESNLCSRTWQAFTVWRMATWRKLDDGKDENSPMENFYVPKKGWKYVHLSVYVYIYIYTYILYNVYIHIYIYI